MTTRSPGIHDIVQEGHHPEMPVEPETLRQVPERPADPQPPTGSSGSWPSIVSRRREAAVAKLEGKVVLPAPLGPSTPVIPAGTARPTRPSAHSRP